MTDAILIPLGQDRFALVDACDAHLAELSWTVMNSRSTAYAQRRARAPDGGWRTVLLHRTVLGLELGDGKYGDHINGDGLDCRRANLRVVTNSENLRSRGGPNRNCTSRYLGVCLTGKGQWKAQIHIGGQNKHLGFYETEEEANAARLKAERELWGVTPRRAAAHDASENDVSEE